MSQNSKKYSVLTKNIGLFTISSFGSKIITFLLVPLYTTVLSTGDYGTVDLITTTVQLLIPLLTLNIQDAVLRFSLDGAYKKEDVFKSFVKINFIAGTGLGIALLALYSIGIIRLNRYYLAFLYIQFLCGAINNSLQMYSKANNMVIVLTIGGLANTLITCGLNVVMLLVLKWGVLGYMVANTVGLIVYNIYIWIAGNAKNAFISGRARKDVLKKMILYSAPLIANSLAWWVNSASDRYILTAFKGVAENGIYSVSYKIPTILSTITGIFYNAWSISAITEFDKDDNDGFMGNTYSAYSMISVLACSAIMIINIPIARLLYAKDFFGAWKYVPFLLVGTVFNGLSLFEGCIFGAVKKTGDVSKTTVLGAVANTASNLFLIYFFGALGAAAATMFGYMVTYCARTHKMKSIIAMKTCWNKHYWCYFLLTFQAFIGLNSKMWFVELGIFGILFVLYREYIGIAIEMVMRMLKRKKNQ